MSSGKCSTSRLLPLGFVTFDLIGVSIAGRASSSASPASASTMMGCAAVAPSVQTGPMKRQPFVPRTFARSLHSAVITAPASRGWHVAMGRWIAWMDPMSGQRCAGT